MFCSYNHHTLCSSDVLHVKIKVGIVCMTGVAIFGFYFDRRLAHCGGHEML